MGEWAHGICGCLSDIGVCCIAWLAPCVTVGQNAEAIGQGSCLTHGCLSMVPCVNIYCMAKNREMVRERVGIDGSLVGDCAMLCCCGLCAIIQVQNGDVVLERMHRKSLTPKNN